MKTKFQNETFCGGPPQELNQLHGNAKHAVLLTLEGVIRPHLSRACQELVEPIRFLPGATDGLRLLAENDFCVVAITEDAEIAPRHGFQKRPTHWAERWLMEIALRRGRVDGIYARPGSGTNWLDRAEIAGAVIRQILRELRLPAWDVHFVTDNPVDLAAASALGCMGILLQRDAFLHTLPANPYEPEVASNLFQAAERIVMQRVNPLLRAVEEAAPQRSWQP